MMQGFFTYLPSELTMNIMSRLNAHSVMNCKCVCKPWLSLLKTKEFAKSYFSKSIPCLIAIDKEVCTTYEFEEGDGHEHHKQRYTPLTKCDCSGLRHIVGAANGLLLISEQKNMKSFHEPLGLNVINPMTDECIRISPPEKEFNKIWPHVYSHGFGVSRSGQLKVVAINGNLKLLRGLGSDEYEYTYERNYDAIFDSSEVYVYTLGTRSWRSISPGPMVEYDCDQNVAFLGGKIYWFVYDLNECSWISCFDLEDEQFSLIPTPPDLPCPLERSHVGVYALEDCLCLSSDWSDAELVIWLMKDNKGEKIWTKEFVIRKRQHPYVFDDDNPFLSSYHVYKIYKDDGILIANPDSYIFHYSRVTNTINAIEILDTDIFKEYILHTPSLVSLRSRFVKEIVITQFSKRSCVM